MSESEEAKKILKQLNQQGYSNDRSKESYERRSKKLDKEFYKLKENAHKKGIKNNDSFDELPSGLVFMIDNFIITT